MKFSSSCGNIFYVHFRTCASGNFVFMKPFVFRLFVFIFTVRATFCYSFISFAFVKEKRVYSAN